MKQDLNQAKTKIYSDKSQKNLKLKEENIKEQQTIKE